MIGRDASRTDGYPLAIAATVGLFALWGLAHGVYGIVVPQFTKFFGFSPVQSLLTHSSFPITYFALAIPAALFLRRFGYKLGLILGLSAFSLGSFLLYQAVSQFESLYLFAAVVLTSAGWALLETSTNPLIAQMGSPETSVRRLNLAQAFYPIGICIPAYLGHWITIPKVVVGDAHMVETVVRPYIVVGLAVLFLALLIEYLNFPQVARAGIAPRVRARDEIRALLARRDIVSGMGAMAAFMMALICTWSASGKYAQHVIPGLSGASAAGLALYMWIVCGIGRFAGTGLMYRFDPGRLLVVSAGACVLLPVAAAAIDTSLGIACLLGTSFFSSIMFPTVFGMTIKDLGPQTKSASGLLVMAAGFGAIIGTIAMRLALAVSAVHIALMLASLGFAGVFAFALAKRRAHAPFFAPEIRSAVL